MSLGNIQSIISNNTNKVFFFSKPNCIYCDKLQQQLEYLSIPYEKVLLEDSTLIQDLVIITGHRTFPQLFFGTEFIGGFSEFEKLCYTNKIEEKLMPLGIKPELDF